MNQIWYDHLQYFKNHSSYWLCLVLWRYILFQFAIWFCSFSLAFLFLPWIDKQYNWRNYSDLKEGAICNVQRVICQYQGEYRTEYHIIHANNNRIAKVLAHSIPFMFSILVRFDMIWFWLWFRFRFQIDAI